MTLRETHRVMRAWTDLIAGIQAAGPSLSPFLDPLLDLKLKAARLRYVVNLSARRPRDRH